MTHGHRDYGASGPASTVYALRDLGELAARLGSIVTFDRRGDVVMLDSFEHGRKGWAENLYGTGAASALSVAYRRSGAYSLKLTTGSDGSEAVKVSRYIPRPVLSKFGFEFSFAWDTPLNQLVFGMQPFWGATYDLYMISISRASQKIDLWTDAGAYETIASGLSIQSDHWLFNTVKLVADMEAKKYERLILNHTEYDLTDYDGQSVVDSSMPQLEVWCQPTSNTGQNLVTYLDDMIVTQNEP